MKKLLLLSLIAVLASFGLSGCSDSKDDKVVPYYTPIDFTKPETLVGTYNVSFFGTIATTEFEEGVKTILSVVSTDCYKLAVTAIGMGNDISLCLPSEAEGGKVKLYGGKVIITLKDGFLNVASKMQMHGGVFATGLGAMAADDTYQYSIYAPVPVANAQNAGTSAVKGVSGRNLTVNTWNDLSPFEFSQNLDGSLHIDMTLAGKLVMGAWLVDALTVVDAVKISNIPENLDVNKLFVDSVDDGKGGNWFAKFVANPVNTKPDPAQ